MRDSKSWKKIYFLKYSSGSLLVLDQQWEIICKSVSCIFMTSCAVQCYVMRYLNYLILWWSMKHDMFLALLLCISYILRHLVPIISISTESVNGIVRKVICLIWLLLKKHLTRFSHKVIFFFNCASPILTY